MKLPIAHARLISKLSEKFFMFLLTTLASLAFAAELTQQTAEPEPVIGFARVVARNPVLTERERSGRFFDPRFELKEYVDDVTERGMWVKRSNGHVLVVDPASLPMYHRLLSLLAVETLTKQPESRMKLNDLEGDLKELVKTRIDASTYTVRQVTFTVPDWDENSEIHLRTVLNVIIETEFGTVHFHLAPLPHGRQAPKSQLPPGGFGFTGGGSPTVATGAERFYRLHGWNLTIRELIPAPDHEKAFEEYFTLLQQTISEIGQDADATLLRLHQPVRNLTANTLQLNGLDLSRVEIGGQLPDEMKQVLLEGGGRLSLLDPETLQDSGPVPGYLRELVSKGTVVEAHINCFLGRPDLVETHLDFKVPFE